MSDIQVAGHGLILSGLKNTEGKAVVFKPYSDREHQFYSFIFSETSDHQQIRLREFVPRFYGIKEVDGQKYLMLEDLTANYRSPCIADIKIGCRQYTTDMTEKKITYSIKKNVVSTSAKFSIRLAGYRTYDFEKKEFVKMEKAEAKKQTSTEIESVVALLQSFFDCNKEVQQIINPIVDLKPKVEEMLSFFETQTFLRLYSSSILIIFDGDNDLIPATIKLIDFAHWVHLPTEGERLIAELREEEISAGIVDNGPSGTDLGVLIGLRSLLLVFDQIISRLRSRGDKSPTD